MRYLWICFAVLSLTLLGCSGDNGSSDEGSGTNLEDAAKDAGDAMKDAAKDAGDAMKDAANKTIDFACADPNCTKTKQGTMADPPS